LALLAWLHSSLFVPHSHFFYRLASVPSFFSFNDTPPTEIYTLSLHDALPISRTASRLPVATATCTASSSRRSIFVPSERRRCTRSEEHTSELQSHLNLVCRLLLEKKKNKIHIKKHNS